MSKSPMTSLYARCRRGLSASALDTRAVGPDRHRHARGVGSACAWLCRQSDFEINLNAGGRVVIAPPQFNLHGSVGKIIQFFQDNLTNREVSTPAPCLSFSAKIPGGMSGGPIFDKEGAYVHGVVSKGWENQEGPENFSFGTMLRPSMSIPIARMGGKSLDEMQKRQTEGIGRPVRCGSVARH